MTAGKGQPSPGQLTPENEASEPREGAADKEERHMQTMTGPTKSEFGEGEGLDARLQAQIGHKLKAMFNEVANAPIPEKFLDLLRELDVKESGN